MSATFDDLNINGRQYPGVMSSTNSAASYSYTSPDPSTGESLGSVDLASTGDVDDAVAAAGRAFREWSRVTPAERSALLAKTAEILEGKAEELAQAETAQCGKPIRLSR